MVPTTSRMSRSEPRGGSMKSTIAQSTMRRGSARGWYPCHKKRQASESFVVRWSRAAVWTRDRRKRKPSGTRSGQEGEEVGPEDAVLRGAEPALDVGVRAQVAEALAGPVVVLEGLALDRGEDGAGHEREHEAEHRENHRDQIKAQRSEQQRVVLLHGPEARAREERAEIEVEAAQEVEPGGVFGLEVRAVDRAE
eukprot:3941265-Rhodomonas_salina.1